MNLNWLFVTLVISGVRFLDYTVIYEILKTIFDNTSMACLTLPQVPVLLY